jgi:hypothetical protein
MADPIAAATCAAGCAGVDQAMKCSLDCVTNNPTDPTKAMACGLDCTMEGIKLICPTEVPACQASTTCTAFFATAMAADDDGEPTAAELAAAGSEAQALYTCMTKNNFGDTTIITSTIVTTKPFTTLEPFTTTTSVDGAATGAATGATKPFTTAEPFTTMAIPTPASSESSDWRLNCSLPCATENMTDVSVEEACAMDCAMEQFKLSCPTEMTACMASTACTEFLAADDDGGEPTAAELTAAGSDAQALYTCIKNSFGGDDDGNNDGVTTTTSTSTVTTVPRAVVVTDTIMNAGYTGLSPALEVSFLQHFGEFYHYFGQGSTANGDLGGIVLGNKPSDALLVTTANGETGYFHKTQNKTQAVNDFLKDHFPSDAGKPGACLSKGCMADISNLKVNLLDGGAVLATATIEYYGADGATKVTTEDVTMVSTYDNTKDAIFGTGKATTFDDSVENWHAMQIWHETRATAKLDAWAVFDDAVTVDEQKALGAVYTKHVEARNDAIKDNNKTPDNLPAMKRLMFGNQGGLALRYIDSNKIAASDAGSTVASFTAQDTTAAADFFNKIDVVHNDVQGTSNPLYFKEEKTKLVFKRITATVVQMTASGYYYSKDLTSNVETKVLTTQMDFIFASGPAAITQGSSPWRCIAIVGEEIQHIANFANGDESGFSISERFAFQLYLEKTFGHFIRGEYSAAARAGMQRNHAIGAKIITDPNSAGLDYVFDTRDDMASVFALISTQLDIKNTAKLSLKTLKRLSGDSALAEGTLDIYNDLKQLAQSIDVMVIAFYGKSDPTQASSWQIVYLATTTKAIPTGPSLAFEEPGSEEDYLIAQAWLDEYVDARNRALKKNDVNDPTYFDKPKAKFNVINKKGGFVFGYDGDAGTFGCTDEPACKAPDDGATKMLAIRNQKDAQDRALYGDGFTLFFNTPSVYVTKTGAIMHLKATGGYYKKSDDDDDNAIPDTILADIQLDWFLTPNLGETFKTCTDDCGTEPVQLQSYAGFAAFGESMTRITTYSDAKNTTSQEILDAYRLHLDEFYGHLAAGEFHQAAQAGSMGDHGIALHVVDENDSISNATQYVADSREYASVLQDLYTPQNGANSDISIKVTDVTFTPVGVHHGFSAISTGTVTVKKAGGAIERVRDFWMVSVTPTENAWQAGIWYETLVYMKDRASADFTTPPTYEFVEDCKKTVNGLAASEMGEGDDDGSGRMSRRFRRGSHTVKCSTDCATNNPTDPVAATKCAAGCAGVDQAMKCSLDCVTNNPTDPTKATACGLDCTMEGIKLICPTEMPACMASTTCTAFLATAMAAGDDGEPTAAELTAAGSEAQALYTCMTKPNFGGDDDGNNDDGNDDAATAAPVTDAPVTTPPPAVAPSITCSVPKGTTVKNNLFGGSVPFTTEFRVTEIMSAWAASRNAAKADASLSNAAAIDAVIPTWDGPIALTSGGRSYVLATKADLTKVLDEQDERLTTRYGSHAFNLDMATQVVQRITENYVLVTRSGALVRGGATSTSEIVTLDMSLVLTFNADAEQWDAVAMMFDYVVADPVASSTKNKGKGGRAFGYFILVCLIIAIVGFGAYKAKENMGGTNHESMYNDTSGAALGEFANPLANPGGGGGGGEAMIEDSSA